MDAQKNFKLRTTVEEVLEIEKYITLDTIFKVQDIQEKAYTTVNNTVRDLKWSFIISLCDCYVAGYISGVRAERERKKTTRK